MTTAVLSDYANESIESPPIDKLMSVIARTAAIQWRSLTSTSEKVSPLFDSSDDNLENLSNLRNISFSQLTINRELFDDFRLGVKPINQYSVTVEYKLVGKGKPVINKEMLIDN